MIQLRAKEEDSNVMAEEMDTLRHTLKQREDDLMEVGKQISEIRAAQIRLDYEENGESIILLNKEMGTLRVHLKERDESLAQTEKELSRARHEILQLQKQVEGEKEKIKIQLKSKRQLVDDVSTHKEVIESLERRIAILHE